MIKVSISVAAVAVVGLLAYGGLKVTKSVLGVEEQTMQCSGLLQKVCKLDLGREIKDASYYATTAREIKDLFPADTINVHLSGMGGSAEGAIRLVDALQRTKAHVVAVIEGDIASGHSFIAFSIKDVRFESQGFALFHNISTSNMETTLCADVEGLDRGMSAKDKCIEDMRAINVIYNNILEFIPRQILTSAELDLYHQGHDIILSFDELKKRLQENK